MSPPCVARFGSQQGSSQKDEPQASKTVDQDEPASRRRKEKRASKWARGDKSLSILKVKLPKCSINKLSKRKKTKDDGKTLGRSMLKPTARKPRTPVTGTGDSQGAGTGFDPFCFSQTPTSKAAEKKKKVKLTVLRTISKMLEENHFIRERLIALSQVQ